MILTLGEVKTWLRVDGLDEDGVIYLLIAAAEKYLTNATGHVFTEKNELAKLFCLVLVSDWYENREMIGKVSEKIRTTVESILVQLSHCYEST
ncbi:head-tail connector protein [Ammoniphilus sp. YIM 78166]|uniref:head-tail connector protein n=1 Tax=Ammoniphilus sp. YIM 78166 TaxID=1644106 RepID=UPI001070001C|nr:head-tail connector protein [Ammoniphilus sp. YIM 78166]